MSDVPPKPGAPSAGEAPPSSHLPAPITPPPADQSTIGAAISAAASHVLSALRFYSRLPLPVFAFETAPHAPLDFARAPIAVVIAGAVLGAIAGIILVAASWLDIPPLLAALLAIATLALVTGSLHEDGLADTADGLGGGQTPERRLEIMRDSRIGSYGAIAIVLSIAIRATALATLIERIDPIGAALALISVAATSRIAGLLPLWLLPPARTSGVAASVTAPTSASIAIGTLVCLGLTFVATWPFGVLILASAVSFATAFAAAYALTRIAEAKINGHTGDTAGAAQQLAEATMLIALTAATSPQWLL